jgi:hypothetical protein
LPAPAAPHLITLILHQLEQVLRFPKKRDANHRKKITNQDAARWLIRLVPAQGNAIGSGNFLDGLSGGLSATLGMKFIRW